MSHLLSSETLFLADRDLDPPRLVCLERDDLLELDLEQDDLLEDLDFLDDLEPFLPDLPVLLVWTEAFLTCLPELVLDFFTPTFLPLELVLLPLREWEVL